jgi:hypothetical protein
VPRLASLRDRTPDGRLILISSDGRRFAPGPVKTSQKALEDRDAVVDDLATLAIELEQGGESRPTSLARAARLLAALPVRINAARATPTSSHGALPSCSRGSPATRPWQGSAVHQGA